MSNEIFYHSVDYPLSILNTCLYVIVLIFSIYNSVKYLREPHPRKFYIGFFFGFVNASIVVGILYFCNYWIRIFQDNNVGAQFAFYIIHDLPSVLFAMSLLSQGFLLIELNSSNWIIKNLEARVCLLRTIFALIWLLIIVIFILLQLYLAYQNNIKKFYDSYEETLFIALVLILPLFVLLIPGLQMMKRIKSFSESLYKEERIKICKIIFVVGGAICIRFVYDVIIFHIISHYYFDYIILCEEIATLVTELGVIVILILSFATEFTLSKVKFKLFYDKVDKFIDLVEIPEDKINITTEEDEPAADVRTIISLPPEHITGTFMLSTRQINDQEKGSEDISYFIED